MITVHRKQKISNAMWVMSCPRCGRTLSSACERSWLPDVAWCNCDTKQKDNDNGDNKGM